MIVCSYVASIGLAKDRSRKDRRSPFKTTVGKIAYPGYTYPGYGHTPDMKSQDMMPIYPGNGAHITFDINHMETPITYS